MKTNVGNLVLITLDLGREILLLHRPPETEADKQRARRKVGCNRWVMPGGGTEESDKSEIHAVKRETKQETGLFFPISVFRKVGQLEGYFQKDAAEPTWIVHIFRVEAWPEMRDMIRFDPEEHDGIGWFPKKKMPWDKMIVSDREWLERLIEGEQLAIRVVFDGSYDKLVECTMERQKFS